MEKKEPAWGLGRAAVTALFSISLRAAEWALRIAIIFLDALS